MWLLLSASIGLIVAGLGGAIYVGQRRDGLRVPTEGEVAWTHPAGEAAYWRGRMEAIEYQFADRDAPPASNAS